MSLLDWLNQNLNQGSQMFPGGSLIDYRLIFKGPKCILIRVIGLKAIIGLLKIDQIHNSINSMK